ncbi:MAG: PAS domain-containing protein [Candidatus Thorarchaeota archaeon]
MKKTTKLLLVDDDNPLLEIAETFLLKQDQNLKIAAVNSAANALKKMNEQDFDVIVCDYQMPGMDGLELLEKLRGEGNLIPFIIFTGRGREDVVIRALNLGATNYVQKGGDPKSQYAELAHLIHRAVEHASGQKALLESEKQYRITLNSIRDAIHVVDETLRIVLVNRAFTEWMEKLSLDTQIQGKTVVEAFPFLPVKVLDEYRYVLESGKSLVTEERNKINGQVVLTEVVKIPILRDKKVSQVVTVIRDITERKDMEDSLRKSERARTAILDSIGEHVNYYENLDMRIRWTNTAAAESVNMTPEEIVGKPCYETWHGTERPCDFCPVIKAFETGESHHREMRTPDGRVWLVKGYPVRDENGTLIGVVEVTRETTEQVIAEDALKESEEKHRTLVQSLNDTIFVLNKDDAFVEFYPPGTVDSLAHQGRVIGRNIKDILPPKGADTLSRLSAEVRKTGKHTSTEYSMPMGDDRRWFSCGIDLHQDGESTVFVARDITETRMTEQALKESESSYRSIFENSPVSIWIEDFCEVKKYVDDLQASGIVDINEFLLENPDEVTKCTELVKVIDMNQATIDLHNVRSKAHLLGNLNNIILDDALDMFREEIVALTGGKQYFAKEATMLNLSGENKHLLVQLIVPPGYEVTLSRVLVFMEDLTEKMKSQDILLKQKQELSEFAHAMGHDLRGSLHAIIGYANLLEEEYDQSRAQEITNLTKGMAAMLEQSIVLADAGQVIGETHPVDLDKLVAEVAATIVPKGTRFTQQKLPVVNCDREKMKQVVQNLLVNAIQHGKPNLIEVEAENGDGSVSLLFSNNGKIIAEKEREKIFDRGFTTKEGGGMGLTIVKKIVDAHEWMITLEPSEKTTFRLTIPKAQAQ